MKVLVDKVPNRCQDCLFLGSIVIPSITKFKTYTGCKLMDLKISMELGTMTKPNNCPLKELSE